MLTTNTDLLDAYKANARQITGKVIYYNLAGEPVELAPEGDLVSFSIEKTAPSGKLFGFALSQKITVEALKIHDGIQKGTKLVPYLGIVSNDVETNIELPYFYVDTVEFNKVNKTTTITGYDILSNKTAIKDINITYPITAQAYAIQVLAAIGATIGDFEGYNFNIANAEAANWNGYEVVQDVLADIAEASGTICYVTSGNNVKFRLIDSDVVDDTLTPANYFAFSTGDTITLNRFGASNELGNSLAIGVDGDIQVLWENAFMPQDNEWSLNSALTQISLLLKGTQGLAYNLIWRGCPYYEIGDHIKIVELPKEPGAEPEEKHVFYFNETLTYNGGMRAVSNWETIENEEVDAAPPTVSTLISKTMAKVDKVNQEITLLAQKVEENDAGKLTEEIAELKVTTDAITAEVSKNSDDLEYVQTQLTSENLSVLVNTEVNSIKTSTGFTFDGSGLNISKDGAATTTNLNENGMIIYDLNQDAVLTVNNVGVSATNLQANTYLIIGDRSRFENYDDANGTARTGCFWLQ